MTLPLPKLTQPEAPSLSSLRPEVEESLREVLLRYHIPELDAEKLLRETVLEMLYKAEGPVDFGRRVGPVLQAKCRTYWQTRRWRTYHPTASTTTRTQPAQASAQPPRTVRPRDTWTRRLRDALRNFDF